jgi:hypothetical protein
MKSVGGQKASVGMVVGRKCKKGIGGQEKFKEWKRDNTADAKQKYNKAKKFAKRAVSIAMREASERSMKRDGE